MSNDHVKERIENQNEVSGSTLKISATLNTRPADWLNITGNQTSFP